MNSEQALMQLASKNFRRGQIIAQVADSHITPEIEEMIEVLCEIPGMGRQTAIELLFTLGVKMLDIPKEN